ncbi:response regulator transcription factor [Paramagnetospirillum magneticum]|uniref:Response regulator consisting of a CheY-like receiver domain and a winged-helix DNA-binding domain n=1 Tax=Paramagnetospirillum magneticum (strain ATCC 700264 / AMB-1) TaxID=342108 RepID=Q2W1S0_PARM1|nr:response regulator transcription factor [Paramagnetospirillum magneticum]BAE52205.1 Response regulator consisting of a CheY-like receiver domain and a winged-helix DNA-binding domain [Paramagnetospirillum magneticum AMB-1]
MTPAHILVVDDDATVRSILSGILTAQGYRVTPCGGGEEMWAALAAGPADLVLLDVEMPGEDGYTLVQRLRERFALGIILLTGHTALEHKLHGLEIGADEFLSKPCDRRELLARIKSLLRRVPSVPVRTPPKRPTSCPVCGSRVRYSLETEAGAVGSCRACSWSKFYEG